MRHNLLLALLAAVVLAAPSASADTPQPVYTSYGKNVVVQGMDGGYPVTINGSFSVSATNPSVGTDNAAAPGSSTQVGIQDGAGKLQAVSATNPLPITGSISASNPSVGTNTSAIPTSSTLLGARDGSGNLQALDKSANGLKVDGSATTQPVSGTFWQATQPVSGTFWQATQPVSGTVTATQATGSNLHVQVDTAPTTAVTGTFWQATQPISAAALPLPSGASQDRTTAVAPNACRLSDGTAFYKPTTPSDTQPVSGTFWQTTQPVSIDTMPSTPVTGTFWQSTQPVSVADNRVSGTISAASSFGSIGANSWNNASCAAGACVTASVDGNADADVYITGQWSGVVYIDGSPDGTNWTDMVVANMGFLVAPTFHSGLSGTGVGSTQNAVYKLNVAGFQQVRVRAATGATFGAANITVQWNITPSSGAVVSLDRALPTGTNTLGAVTQSGTWNVNQSGTWNVNALQSGTWTVQPGNTANTVAWKVDNSAVTQPISASSLPLPSGAATSAKQPALGTAGAAAADVISVQGIASMTPLKVDGSAVTQPVSGTFWQATQPVSGTFWQATQPVSGTVTSNIGTTNGLALDATLTGGTAQTKITDGTNVATVKAASTLPAATDKAVVVTARDSVSVTAANTTPWVVKPSDGTNAVAFKAASTAAGVGDPSMVVAFSPNSPLPTGSNVIGSLSANQTVNVSQFGGTAVVTGGVAGSHGVGGLAAAGAAASGNPVLIGGKGFNGIVNVPPYCDKSLYVSVSAAAADQQIIAAVASQKIYVCSYAFDASVSTAATTLRFVEGTGTACATGKANVSAILITLPTAAPTVPNITMGGVTNPGIPMTATAGDALCVEAASGTNAVTVNGQITYTQF